MHNRIKVMIQVPYLRGLGEADAKRSWMQGKFPTRSLGIRVNVYLLDLTQQEAMIILIIHPSELSQAVSNKVKAVLRPWAANKNSEESSQQIEAPHNPMHSITAIEIDDGRSHLNAMLRFHTQLAIAQNSS